MSDVALSLLRFVLLALLLFGPLILFLLFQHRVASRPLRLGIAVVFAVVTGIAAWAIAGTIGLAVHVRTARVTVPTAAAGPVLFAFTLVLLAIFALRGPAQARPSAHRPVPDGAPAMQRATPPPSADRAASGSSMQEGLPVVRAAALGSTKRQSSNRPHRRLFWILVGIYGLGLLAWPQMSFGAVFAFDDPNANKLLSWYIAASIWLYPAYVAAGFVLGFYNRNPSAIVLALKTSVPLLSAMWFFLIPGIPALIGAWLRSPSVEEVVRQRGELEARLDPIYAQRTAAVRARDAAMDARVAIQRGEAALIPYTPGEADYLGVEGAPPMDGLTAHAIIERSEHLSGIVALLREDAAHPRSRMGDRETYDYSLYYSDTFKAFADARREYMIQFNTEIARHLRGGN